MEANISFDSGNKIEKQTKASRSKKNKKMFVYIPSKEQEKSSNQSLIQSPNHQNLKTTTRKMEKIRIIRRNLFTNLPKIKKKRKLIRIATKKISKITILNAITTKFLKI